MTDGVDERAEYDRGVRRERFGTVCVECGKAVEGFPDGRECLECGGVVVRQEAERRVELARELVDDVLDDLDDDESAALGLGLARSGLRKAANDLGSDDADGGTA